MSIVRRSLLTKIAATVRKGGQRPESFRDVSRGGGGGLTEDIYGWGAAGGALLGAGIGGAVLGPVGVPIGGAAGAVDGLILSEIYGGPQLRQQRRALRAEQQAYDRAQRYLNATGEDEVDLPDRPRNRGLGRGIGAFTFGAPGHIVGATVDRIQQEEALDGYLADVNRATRV